MTTVESKNEKRGGCLTAFLILMLIADLLTGLYYLLAGSTARQLFPDLPAWAIPGLGLLALADLVFVIAIWKWQKWGVYGVIGSTVVVFYST